MRSLAVLAVAMRGAHAKTGARLRPATTARGSGSKCSHARSYACLCLGPLFESDVSFAFRGRVSRSKLLAAGTPVGNWSRRNTWEVPTANAQVEPGGGAASLWHGNDQRTSDASCTSGNWPRFGPRRLRRRCSRLTTTRGAFCQPSLEYDTMLFKSDMALVHLPPRQRRYKYTR